MRRFVGGLARQLNEREIRTGKRTHPVSSGDNNPRNKLGLSSVPEWIRSLGNYHGVALIDRIVDIVVMMILTPDDSGHRFLSSFRSQIHFTFSGGAV